MKPYKPYKNLGIILTRLETHLMHEVYLQFDHWLLIVHDAFLVEEIQKDELKAMMINSALEQGYIIPNVSTKLADSRIFKLQGLHHEMILETRVND
ncbi:MAG: hypothetical protein HN542_04560 [Flavobacteriales bacterium]|jgi:hypothetical protein|nr:hypothetical protein [Flavobacteriales bacterium]